MITLRCEITCNLCNKVEGKVGVRPVLQKNGKTVVACLEFKYPDGWSCISGNHYCESCGRVEEVRRYNEKMKREYERKHYGE